MPPIFTPLPSSFLPPAAAENFQSSGGLPSFTPTAPFQLWPVGCGLGLSSLPQKSSPPPL